MALPETYIAVLLKMANVFSKYEAAVGYPPVLVGGAAVAVQTQGAFMSGDFDLFAPNDEVLHQCLIEAGFVADERVGRLIGGYYLPGFEEFGVEAISGQLFEGRSERDRLIRFSIGQGSSIVIPSFEDMIADRLGQHAVAGKSDNSRLEQARAIFKLAEMLDLDYLKRRVADEGGDFHLLEG